MTMLLCQKKIISEDFSTRYVCNSKDCFVFFPTKKALINEFNDGYYNLSMYQFRAFYVKSRRAMI